MSRLQSISQRQ